MQAAKPLRVVVTGSNKGIGYGIIEYILQQSSHGGPKCSLIMTSRDHQNGVEAINKLKATYPDADVHQLALDISCKESVNKFVQELKKEGPIDVLFNNAGISFNGPRIDKEVVEGTMGVNYHGTRYLTETLLDNDLIVPNGKIIFISSMAGKFNQLPTRNPEVYATLSKYKEGSLTVEALEKIIKDFETDMVDESKRSRWNNTIYGASKMYLSIYVYLLSRSSRITERGIQVYACCPGWCQTDMTKGMKAPLTSLQGAETPYFLMTLTDKVDDKYQGLFFSNKTVTSLD